MDEKERQKGLRGFDFRRNLEGLLYLEKLMGIDMIPKGDVDTPKVQDSFEGFRQKVLQCRRCALHQGRRQVVFGVGSSKAPLMFVGEAPGYEEDIQGEPFVGKAGRLLTQTLKELGISRDQVYIANIVKCRPPENREPRLAEIVACLPYLLRQIEFIKPKVICALGRISAQTLLSTQTPMSQLRGRFHEHNNMRIFPAFHPAYILRNPSDHKIYKNDIKRVCKEAGLIE